jgi:ribosomal protein S19E (S16A)
MNGYELAALLRNKLTIANAMQAANKLEELEDKLKAKTGKKNESKPSSNQNQTSVFAKPETAYDNGFESDPS